MHLRAHWPEASASLLAWLADHGKRERTWKKDLFLVGDPVYTVEHAANDSLAMRAAAVLDPTRFARLKKTRAYPR